ncbi:hypothetical protein [Cupriavidus pauculus]|uniref:hypothetical protein n=1 Tax=Cupriavidus pauculus TaxID=82633 RepID=UPI001FCFE4EF|nr:hypothetical protein [Cupriavidus pauculus]
MAKLSKTKQSVLNQFESRTDEWSFADFDRVFIAEVGGRHTNYQDAKMAISAAHKEGLWPKTVARYILTNYRSFGSTPGELIAAGRDVVASLSAAERAEWKLK